MIETRECCHDREYHEEGSATVMADLRKRKDHLIESLIRMSDKLEKINRVMTKRDLLRVAI
jgi:hypothetical protein